MYHVRTMNLMSDFGFNINSSAHETLTNFYFWFPKSCETRQSTSTHSHSYVISGRESYFMHIVRHSTGDRPKQHEQKILGFAATQEIVQIRNQCHVYDELIYLNQHDSKLTDLRTEFCLHRFLRFLHPARKVSPREGGGQQLSEHLWECPR